VLLHILPAFAVCSQGGLSPSSRDTPGSGSANKKKPSKKEARVWAGSGGAGGKKISKKAASALDRSARPDGANSEEASALELDQARTTYLPTSEEKPMWELDREENERLGRALDAAARSSSSGESSSSDGGGIWSALSNSYVGNIIQHVTGGKILTDEDLEPVLREMKEILQAKNVALEIANSVCDSVQTALVGKRMESFTAIRSVVLTALRSAVERILTPHSSTDVLRGILDAKAEGRIYTIVFVGVNGVGEYMTFCMLNIATSGPVS
jgi:signal recognition particle receptor subunit alpha